MFRACAVFKLMTSSNLLGAWTGRFLAGDRVERRLAAVLAADVAGYSRLMGANEEETLARLKAVRKSLVDPALASYRGRIVKTTGDGMLVEFASAVDAARCSIEVQRTLAAQNADVPQEIRIEFRTGIHLGDIIIDDTDIFGDGVAATPEFCAISNSCVASCFKARYVGNFTHSVLTRCLECLPAGIWPTLGRKCRSYQAVD